MAPRNIHAVGKTKGNRDDGTGPYTISHKRGMKVAKGSAPPGQRPAHEFGHLLSRWGERSAGTRADYAPTHDRLPGVKYGAHSLYRPVGKAPTKRY
jgi:hypothetical protein